MAALGFAAVCWIVLRRAAAEGWERTHIVDVLFYPALAGLVGARALYLVANPELLADPSTWLDVRNGGLVFYGSVLGGLPVALAVLRWRHLPGRFVFDVFGAALPLGHGISRLGCLLAGCCYGAPADPPWGWHLGSHPHSLAPDHAVLPVQLYEAVFLLGLSAVLHRRLPHRRFDGQIGLSWLAAYAVWRFFLEFLRDDPTRGWVAEAWIGQRLSTSQAVSLGMGALVAVLWTRWQRSGRGSATAGSATGG